jgi:hypothetical protein
MMNLLLFVIARTRRDGAKSDALHVPFGRHSGVRNSRARIPRCPPQTSNPVLPDDIPGPRAEE